jgi:hypothetical protein
MPYKLSCRRLSLGYDRWDQHLSDARHMVANLMKSLTKQNDGRSLAAQFDRRPQAETLAPERR